MLMLQGRCQPSKGLSGVQISCWPSAQHWEDHTSYPFSLSIAGGGQALVEFSSFSLVYIFLQSVLWASLRIRSHKSCLLCNYDKGDRCINWKTPTEARTVTGLLHPIPNGSHNEELRQHFSRSSSCAQTQTKHHKPNIVVGILSRKSENHEEWVPIFGK